MVSFDRSKPEEALVLVAAAVGGLVVLRAFLCFLGALYSTFLRPAKNLKKYGEWAVVTGATDGIGKAMSFELAKKGLNVLLISRTESKLVDVEKELAAKCPKVKVANLAIDYSNFDKAAQEAVSKALSDKQIGILVNNVGISYPHPKFFNELTDAEMEGLVTLNVTSTVAMTRLALPAMLERRRGAIVNMASAAAVAPTALLSGYSGAKGFVLKLSESLNVELAPKGVHVQCQVPLLVATKLSKVRRASWDKPSPASYARAAVACIGYERTCSPYWSHALQLWVMDTLPFFLVNEVTYGMHLGLRKRALAKASKSS
ncbi:putative 3-ketoacyl-CoA reductase [Tribonema minus]|uniref:Putative 3-ketoacyl-CoA reductase n=1 Tax=Tribonema minus TaxID=303371 RepID=A0A836C8X2_9STRA|nr:putative 3-ketoacyl-CoA reductase [Tribonema minus]